MLASAISLSYPQLKFQMELVHITRLVYTAQTPNTLLLWIHLSVGSASLPVLQGPPAEDHPWQSELSLPLLPLCTLRIHPS